VSPEAREAATVILLRDSPGGPEVLLVKRNPAQEFMGGAWVFPGGATHGSDDDELRTAVRELEEEAGIALPGEAELVRFSRWITPAEVSIRFDTHFFVARAPDGAEPSVDGRECVEARWIRPRDALDAGERGELMLVFQRSSISSSSPGSPRWPTLWRAPARGRSCPSNPGCW